MSGFGLAVVGTDTGVGKTTVAEAWLTGLRRRGIDVVAYKPVETGIGPVAPDHRWEPSSTPPDWVRLALASGQPPETCLGQAFPLPAAPWVAARHAGQQVDLPSLTRQYRALCAAHRCVLIEGAGGLCVPYAASVLWADLLCSWKTTVVVVGRSGLGTINHTLLTLAELARRSLPVLGVILNATEAEGPEFNYTSEIIGEFGMVPHPISLPFGPPPREEIAEILCHSAIGAEIISRCRSD